ncbi:SagB family peptide dehydrogenase [Microtetraspora sp. AC03309]|uniref:SagB/ThcOx family dehydrogenase n=1 Tax=Microtetraspora sp. AC03309 TaxID=2779376 RepID=UPI001E41849B|nr:SagB family peptide dehydrogenase [Microtetraspora sp. AC03309]MCC5579624.1 SagB family peptide dehydrogenase [Microtetraspora sp. AC03309]
MTTDDCEERLRLRPGVWSVVDDRGTVHLVQRWGRGQSLGRLDVGRRALLRRLAAETATVQELLDLAARHDVIDTDTDTTTASTAASSAHGVIGEPHGVVGGAHGVTGARHGVTALDDVGGTTRELLDVLLRGGWLETTVGYQGRPLYTLRALCPPPPPPSSMEAAGEELVLSRFAVIRRDERQMTLESPLAWGRVRVHDPRVMALLGGLAQPTAADAVGSLPAPAVARTLRDLRWAGLVVPAGGSEDTTRNLRQWTPHELWFHERTRMRDRLPPERGWGRTSWGKGVFDPLPARRTAYSGISVDLPRPDVDALRRLDPPLAAVVEDRRSTRVHDDGNPITVAQLGELLYRCARIRGSRMEEGEEKLDRPYPSGGAAHELELYPVVRLASGLTPGMYHYDAQEHRLRLVRPAGPDVDRLLMAAGWAAGTETRPQVLIIMAARFGRLMLTYQEMPYSLVLKHVGVLQQTMYLAATAMGLAACALGGGDASAFAAATGLEDLDEGSVGEFALGSRPLT